VLVFVIPAKAGIQTPFLQKLRKQGTIKELGSRFYGKPWIPHQVRNDENGNHLANYREKSNRGNNN